MAFEKYSKSEQATGEFNGGAIVENKPIGFPQDGVGGSHPYSNLFYWAKASSDAGSTIGEHPHQAFEILSFVLDGSIEHYDNHNNRWFPLDKGDVQVIKAGNGIYHAEKLNAGAEMFQIWFNPDFDISLRQDAEYQDYRADMFELSENGNYTSKIIIGGSSPVKLLSESVKIQEIYVKNDFKMELSLDQFHSFYVLDGSAEINGKSVVKDDFIKIFDEETLSVTNQNDLKLFYISNPKILTHRTYFQTFRNRY